MWNWNGQGFIDGNGGVTWATSRFSWKLCERVKMKVPQYYSNHLKNSLLNCLPFGPKTVIPFLLFWFPAAGVLYYHNCLLLEIRVITSWFRNSTTMISGSKIKCYSGLQINACDTLCGLNNKTNLHPAVIYVLFFGDVNCNVERTIPSTSTISHQLESVHRPGALQVGVSH